MEIYITIIVIVMWGLHFRRKENAVKKKYKILASVLTVILCMLFGCERKETVYLSETDSLQEEKAGKTEEAGQDMGLQEEMGISGTADTNFQAKTEPQGQETVFYIVHICGAVERPGVYSLEEGSRVYQAVEAAGGFTKEAAQDYLNQALVLSDGMKLSIPTEEEVRQAEEAGTGSDSFLTDIDGFKTATREEPSGKVNINTAAEEILCTLSGIGSGKAKSIIEYREKNGAFLKIEDIMQVEGIKEGLFQRIKDSITV